MRQKLFAAVGIVLLVRCMGHPQPQKRTLADMRTLGTALEARATDTNSYPNVTSVDELAPLLQPTYIREIPRTDGWRNPLRYEHEVISPTVDSFRLGSAGRDGRWQRARLIDYTPLTTTSPDDDIVYANGSFVQYPEGVQTQ